MATLVLTLIGDDRSGLVSAVAEVVATHGGNWERSEMAELAGKFAGIVEVTVPDAAVETLAAALEPLQGTLDITVRTGATTPASDGIAAASARATLMILGSDRSGIVREITEVLAAHRINIVSMHTETRDAPMAGGRLFDARATLEPPDGIDLEVVRAALERLAHELMVDIDLDAAWTDVAR